jgi:Ankyrin repeats (3 copies)
MAKAVRCVVALVAAAAGGVWMADSYGSNEVSADGETAAQVFVEPKLVALAKAIERADLLALERAAKNGADTRTRGKGGETLLHWAFLKEGTPLFIYEWLLNAGANPDVPLANGIYSALQLASGSIRRDVLELMLKRGANPNVQAANTFTPLENAIASQYDGNVQILLKHGADPNLGNSCLSTVANARFDYTVLLLQNGLTRDLPLCRRYVEGRNFNQEDAERVKWHKIVLKMLGELGVK